MPKEIKWKSWSDSTIEESEASARLSEKRNELSLIRQTEKAL